jgi:P-type Cu2+ transporter
LAKAIVKYAEDSKINCDEVSDFNAVVGNGLSASLNGEEIFGGNLKYISSKINISEVHKKLVENLAEEGKTPLLFAKSNKLLGIIAVADTVKEDSAKAIKQMQNMGIKTVMLTGDNGKTAKAIGKQTGVDLVISDVLPDGKEAVIRSLSKYGKVAMVGDGINDAPALTRADIGIAIGAGTDVAIDAADVVLMNSRLTDAAAAIRLSRQTLKNIKENLFWAFIYNIIGIPLAAGVWISITGWTLSPMFGAAAMSLSSFCVVTNALRLNLFKIHDTKHDKIKNPVNISLTEFENKENDTMTKIFKVEGMMCPHCENRVKTALEAVDGIESAVASHTGATATVTLSKAVSDDEIIKVITDAGYKASKSK